MTHRGLLLSLLELFDPLVELALKPIDFLTFLAEKLANIVYPLIYFMVIVAH